MSKRPLVILDARDIIRNPSLWKSISRTEACSRSYLSTIATVINNGGLPSATWFDSSNRFFNATGPYDYSRLRYFEYIGKIAPTNLGKTGGVRKPPPTEQDIEPAQALEKEDPRDLPSLFDAVWAPVNPPKDAETEEADITSALMGETILCSVSAQALMPGDSIVFSIYNSGTKEKV